MLTSSTKPLDTSHQLSHSPAVQLVLSLFPGAGLLDEGFRLAGFCVVRGTDTLLGAHIEHFHAAASRFDGVIGGPPCQDFSRARRRPPTGHGLRMLREFARVVTEAQPAWWLMENVPNVPTIHIPGHVTQRFNLYASEFRLDHKRNRSFQFGYKDCPISVQRGSQSHPTKPTPLATDGERGRRKNLADFCAAMGLPRDFDLPGLSRAAKFRAIGNGVPLPMAYAVACAVRDRSVTARGSRCACGCGRGVTQRQITATAACRKRLQRHRDGDGPVTLDLSHPSPFTLHPSLFATKRGPE